MLSSGQSSSKYLNTEIPQMLAIIHLQDLRYWYPFSISIHTETKHYTHVVELKPIKSIRGFNCNEDRSLAASTLTQHRHQLLKRTQTETNVLRTHFVLSAPAYSGLILGHERIVGNGRFVGLKVLTFHTRVYIRAWALFRYGRYHGRIR